MLPFSKEKKLEENEKRKTKRWEAVSQIFHFLILFPFVINCWMAKFTGKSYIVKETYPINSISCTYIVHRPSFTVQSSSYILHKYYSINIHHSIHWKIAHSATHNIPQQWSWYFNVLHQISDYIYYWKNLIHIHIF